MSRSALAGVFAVAVLLSSGAAGATSFDDRGPDREEVVCRRITPDLGTIRSRRVCKTREQWAADAAASQRRQVEREGRSALGRPQDN